ncbi:tyrosine-protein phosphatase [Kitasatospora sp. NPDC057015]|uniref:tyrosine-protein phosphatase n=1 Tax=Kitasatospora sp. NPDC057015 TaxID=3346001 RepID=UPI00362B0297
MDLTDPPAATGPDAVPGAHRLLDIPGVRNARDVGGFTTTQGARVRTGLLYRTGWLAELTPEGALAVAKLGVRTVLDLRDPAEIERWPDRLHGLEPATAHHPLLPQDGEDHYGKPLAEAYRLITDTAADTLPALLGRLTEAGALPALLHCAVGRDRTGIAVAVLLGALGVADEDIVDDYLLSNLGLGLLDGVPQEYVDANGVVRVTEVVGPALITGVLAVLRERYGSPAAFLVEHGLGEQGLARLRELFLDPA